ncbi:hypothetical protein QR680_015911 [Steinernema hermaphroditum]|uniref:G protein-coupled receptor n=1 Tax=Steinernema hermaphroditum TaxID=289476 RepID=A0AA39LLJ7_9BILA|nr:hypothetical protein QR680_015911 [Steinernema hermaphroditum]
MSSLKEMCALSESYSNFALLNYFNAAKVTAAFAGAVLFAIVHHFERITRMFHPNARLILKFHIGFVFVAIAGTIFGDGSDLLRFTVLKWTNRDLTCPVVPLSPYYGVVFKGMKLYGNGGTTITAFAWVIERIYATIFVASYAEYKTTLGWTLGIISTIVITALTTVRVLMADFKSMIPMSMMTGTSYDYSMILHNINAGMEISNVLILLLIISINAGRMRNLHVRIGSSLTYKFALRENGHATALIFPLALLHCVAYFPVAVLTPIITRKGATPVERIFFFSCLDWLPIYFIALPALLFWRHGVQKKAVKQLVRKNLIGERYANARRGRRGEAAKYFEMFNKMIA